MTFCHLYPCDITFITGGVGFKHWKITFTTNYGGAHQYAVIGEYLKGDFAGGKLTDEAIDRMAQDIMDKVEDVCDYDVIEIDGQEIKDYLKRF